VRALVRGIRRLDDAVARAERLLIVALLGVMAAAIFLDAMHRVFSASEGRLESLLVSLAPAALEGIARTVVAPAMLVLAAFGVAFAALRTMDRPRPWRRRQAALGAAAITLLLVAATQALVRGLPNGLVWSQQMALCFMLWVGLVGASLATRDRAHIAFEVAGKIWPPRARPAIELLARLTSAAFCLFLAVLAVAFAREHFSEWRQSDGAAGLFEGFRVPRWVVYGFLPFPFAVMSARFLIHGVRAPDAEKPA